MALVLPEGNDPELQTLLAEARQGSDTVQDLAFSALQHFARDCGLLLGWHAEHGWAIGAGALGRIRKERMLAISNRARYEFQDRFELEVQGIRLLTGANWEQAEAQADRALAPLHRSLEQRRDDTIRLVQQWHAQAIQNLLG